MDWLSKFRREFNEGRKYCRVAVAVAKDGKVIYENGFGYRNIENKDPVTKDTIFGIASITKSFTSLAMMKLVSEGKVAIDDPVTKYLPDFKLSYLEDASKVKYIIS